MELERKIGTGVAIVGAITGIFYGGYSLGEYIGAEKQRIKSYGESLDLAIYVGEACRDNESGCGAVLKMLESEKSEYLKIISQLVR